MLKLDSGSIAGMHRIMRIWMRGGFYAGDLIYEYIEGSLNRKLYIRLSYV